MQFCIFIVSSIQIWSHFLFSNHCLVIWLFFQIKPIGDLTDVRSEFNVGQSVIIYSRRSVFMLCHIKSTVTFISSTFTDDVIVAACIFAPKADSSPVITPKHPHAFLSSLSRLLVFFSIISAAEVVQEAEQSEQKMHHWQAQCQRGEVNPQVSHDSTQTLTRYSTFLHRDTTAWMDFLKLDLMWRNRNWYQYKTLSSTYK